MPYHRLEASGAGYDFAALQAAVDGALAGRERTLVVGLDGIGFLDNSVMRELIRASRRLRDTGRRLHLEATQDRVLTSLRATGLDRVFPLAHV